ncbi:unnamed protein product [Bemisia tabaci]|uniref:Uncharacterized protein n=1 Tax=Bemisia tabaci TaxID=7038 RepID=A0A9P0EZX1_BEMTA|nr:unnamed protein product [Bemisia tabaci]
MSFFLSLLAGVGSALVLWVLADTLWSVLLGLKVHLLPYFKAQNADLVKKYGSWAGWVAFNFHYYRSDPNVLQNIKERLCLIPILPCP